MKKFVFIFLAILGACQQPEESTITLVRIGSLKSIMHEGNLAANVKIDTLELENIWGLGAMDSLKGEVLILNGKPFRSMVQDSSVSTQVDVNLNASLLVYAKVEAWDTLPVSNFEDVDWLIKTQLKKRNITEPSPFILIGKPLKLNYHVINFDPKVSDISKHKEGAYTSTISNTLVTILGFYSTKDKGIFTHHDTNLHMHFIGNLESIAGHVDSFEPGENSFKLLLPTK